MRYLSDSLLVEVYHRALNLQLDPEFIDLLFCEIERRNLSQQTGL